MGKEGQFYADKRKTTHQEGPFFLLLWDLRGTVHGFAKEIFMPSGDLPGLT